MPERTNEVAGQYAAAAEALAAELGVPCLNLWREFQAVEGWGERLLCDGLHLTEEGNAEVYRLLQALIDHRFPELRWVRPGRAQQAAHLRSGCMPCCAGTGAPALKRHCRRHISPSPG